MRTHLALAATLLAVATVPARAQGGAPPFHGNGFEIALPPGYPPMMAQQGAGGDQNMEIAISAKGEKAALLVFHLGMDDVATVDTTLATRRALLQLARSGMAQAEADMQVTGEAREVTRADRVAMRMPVKMDAHGEPATGWVEVSIPRRGPVSMWMVMTITTAPSEGDAAAAEQLMDSFRLTGDGRTAAVDRGPADVFAWIAGRWDWSNVENPCRDNPFTLTVAPDRRTVRLEFTKAADPKDTARVFVYRVLDSDSDHVRGRIDGEERKDDAGNPVVWDFRRISRDAFCWRRTDWAAGNCTAPIVRCTAQGGVASGAAGTALFLPPLAEEKERAG